MRFAFTDAGNIAIVRIALSVQRASKAEREISVDHRALEGQRAKREDVANKRLLSQRKMIIEPVFAWIKCHMGFTRWTVYGLERVRAQWLLICATINLNKVYKRWQSGGLRLATQ